MAQVETVPLQPDTPVTEKGDRPSLDLVENIQRLIERLDNIETRLEALEP